MQEAGEEAEFAQIGETVVAENGVEFAVTGVQCGLTTAGGGFITEEASGEFCGVSFTVLNPGLGLDGLLSIDVPAGTPLDFVEFCRA